MCTGFVRVLRTASYLGWLLLPLLGGSVLGAPAGDQQIGFRLRAVNGREVLYPQVSPTDGDILDRGLHAKVVTFTFEARAGDWVECRDQAGRLLATAMQSSCTDPEDRPLVCFSLEIDTRKLPNGPNRLSFTLYRLPGLDPEVKEALAELVVLIHVLNHRLEVEKLAPDSVVVRLRAGTTLPEKVRNWRFMLFAAALRAPGGEVELPVPGREEGIEAQVPIGGTLGAFRLFPAEPGESGVWPEKELDVRLLVDRRLLSRIARQNRSTAAYLVAAVYDGIAWHWSSVAVVPAGLTAPAKAAQAR